MPLADAIETFSAVINEAVKLKIGYVALVRLVFPNNSIVKAALNALQGNTHIID